MFETTIHWVRQVEPHRLGLMARPRGGDGLTDEIEGWRAASVDIVVSLLASHEIRELELEAEGRLCIERGIDFRRFPIPDRGTPASAREAAAFIDQLHADLVAGKAVVIHCRAGIGRTGLVAACLLHDLAVPVADLFHVLSRARGMDMPDTNAQIRWVEARCAASADRAKAERPVA